MKPCEHHRRRRPRNAAISMPSCQMVRMPPSTGITGPGDEGGAIGSQKLHQVGDIRPWAASRSERDFARRCAGACHPQRPNGSLPCRRRPAPPALTVMPTAGRASARQSHGQLPTTARLGGGRRLVLPSAAGAAHSGNDAILMMRPARWRVAAGHRRLKPRLFAPNVAGKLPQKSHVLGGEPGRGQCFSRVGRTFAVSLLRGRCGD